MRSTRRGYGQDAHRCYGWRLCARILVQAVIDRLRSVARIAVRTLDGVAGACCFPDAERLVAPAASGTELNSEHGVKFNR